MNGRDQGDPVDGSHPTCSPGFLDARAFRFRGFADWVSFSCNAGDRITMGTAQDDGLQKVDTVIELYEHSVTRRQVSYAVPVPNVRVTIAVGSVTGQRISQDGEVIRSPEGGNP